MYDLVNLSRDITATPFPPAISQFSTHVTKIVIVNTHETFCPAFKGSLMMKVDVEIVVAAIVGMRMCFMGARCVNDVILRSRRHGASGSSMIHHRGRGWLQDAFTCDKCANKIDAGSRGTHQGFGTSERFGFTSTVLLTCTQQNLGP
jgi:hypothetical protein